MNALVYVAKDQVAFNQQEKSEVAQNENRKQLHSFLMHKNIANFETFCWNTLNLLVYQLHDNCGEEKISLL